MMFRRYVMTAGLVVLSLVALAGVATLGLARLPEPTWGNPAGGDLTPQISGSTQVGQFFVAPLPGLSSVEVVLAQPPLPAAGEAAGASAQSGGGAEETAEVIFHLALVQSQPSAQEARPAAADLLTRSIRISALSGDLVQRFDFPAISTSRGQAYHFYLESPAATGATALAARYGADSVLDGTPSGAAVSGQALPGNLRFRTGYTLTVGEKLDLLLARMAHGRPYLLGEKGFYVGVMVAYLLILGIFLFRVASSILRTQSTPE